MVDSRQQVGVIRKWETDRGFGFIEIIDDQDGDGDLFCHVSSILTGEKSLNTGDEVLFTKKYDSKRGKTNASNVSTTGKSREVSERNRRN